MNREQNLFSRSSDVALAVIVAITAHQILGQTRGGTCSERCTGHSTEGTAPGLYIGKGILEA